MKESCCWVDMASRSEPEGLRCALGVGHACEVTRTFCRFGPGKPMLFSAKRLMRCCRSPEAVGSESADWYCD